MKKDVLEFFKNLTIMFGIVLLGMFMLWNCMTPYLDCQESSRAVDSCIQHVEEIAELTLDDHISMVVPDKLQNVCKALIWVESRGNSKAHRKSGDCLGILQISPIYVKECNRLQSNVVYSLEDREDIVKSLEMFTIIQNRYNPQHDIHKAIQLHNPTAGPGYKEEVLEKFNTIY